MKILMATMALDIGGAETHIVELSRALAAQGHEIIIVSNGGVYVPHVTAAGVRHVDAPMHRRSLKDMVKSYGILRRLILTQQPDLVHAHARIPAMLCGLLARQMKFPFVTSCHGVYQMSGLLRRLSHWGEQTLAVSEDIRDYLTTEYGLSPRQIHLTINGIDTDSFSPAQEAAPLREALGLGSSFVLGHVSRLDQEPALIARELISLAPALSEAVPGIQILVVGGGNAFEELNTKAEEMNRRLGRRCLLLTGPRTDIPAVMAACDLFVGVSRAALEAMSGGKAVVLSGAQGHTGLFTPQMLQKAIDTNFCCRTDPVASEDTLLQELLHAIALSPKEREELGLYGRSVVQQHYSIRRMTQDALDVYALVRRRKYNVVMSGYYGFANAGDDAVLDAIQSSVSAESDDVSLTVLSSNPPLTEGQFGLHAVSRIHIGKVYSALKSCDVLLSGGGSLLQDATSTRSIVYYIAVMKAARLLGKPVMLYANGIGPVSRPANRRRAKAAVEAASVVTLRDHGSLSELRDMGVTRNDLHVTADPVFRLDAAPSAHHLLSESGLPQGRDFAVVSVRSWPGTEGFPQALAQVCDHLYRTYDLEILFMVMQPVNDTAVTETVRAAMTAPSYVLEASCTPRELMAVLGEAKLCLAMRLHTLIFAARMAVPTLGLVYDPKVEHYLQELGQPSAGHVQSFEAAAAIAAADRLMAHYDETAQELRRRADGLTAAAAKNEQLLLALLHQTKP